MCVITIRQFDNMADDYIYEISVVLLVAVTIFLFGMVAFMCSGCVLFVDSLLKDEKRCREIILELRGKKREEKKLRCDDGSEEKKEEKMDELKKTD